MVLPIATTSIGIGSGNEQIDRRGQAADIRAGLDGVADQHANQDRPWQPTRSGPSMTWNNPLPVTCPSLEDR